MPDIILRDLSRSFGAMVAVRDITATFREGSVTCLLGPSGCGKTTLMRMIAGLETPTAGSICFGNRDVTNLPPKRRDVAMVFQYPVMYRTLSVIENIELPLRQDRSLTAADRARRVDEVLEVLQLGDEKTRHIDVLDSGTRQKVAVGRAIARHCDVVLFDEPTTNVEVHAKLQLIRAFKEFRQRLRQTIIYVTHDQTEAMTLADQIALMRDGVILQRDAPAMLYEQPDSEFGGWFLGNPGMNFIDPRSDEFGGLLYDGFPAPLAPPDGGTPPRIGLRPEYVLVSVSPAPGTVPARIIRSSITIGGQYLLTVTVGNTRLKVKTDPVTGKGLAGEIFIRCPLEHAVFLRDGKRIADRPRLREAVSA